MEAYRARLERHQKALVKLTQDVQTLDPTVEAYVSNLHDGSGLLLGVTFFKGEEINSIHWHEVPYRWSGCGHEEHRNSYHAHEMPFFVEDVFAHFEPVKGKRLGEGQNFKSKEHYLNWLSYLKPFDANDYANTK